jgi:ABC-type polysaccharide/polyol phosphate export permease
MMWLRQTTAIMRLFLRRFALTPLNLTSIFVTPILIALIFGSADARAVSELPIGVQVSHPSAAATAFVNALDAEPGVVVHVYKTNVGLVRAVRRNDVAAGVVYGEPLGLVGNPRDPVSTASLAVVQSLARRTPEPSHTGPVTVTELATAAHSHQTGLPRAAAGMLVYFMFVNVCCNASLLLMEDRRKGVFQRLASSPIPQSSIVTGEVIGRLFIAVVQGLLVALVSSLVLGATWGATLPFTLVIVLIAAVAAGLSVLIGVGLNTSASDALITTNALVASAALLGGCFWSLQIVPRTMQILALITPNAWAMRAIDSLVARGGGISDIAVDLLVLAAFAIALLGLAIWRLRRLTVVAGVAR